ncbi:hypothetical protein ACFX2H_031652 [Malus domestica]
MYSLTKITSQLAELASAAIPHLKFSPSSIILSQDFSAQMPPSQRFPYQLYIFHHPKGANHAHANDSMHVNFDCKKCEEY